MIKKEKEKELAISLRQRGFSYTEILKQVPVAKSTLSLWLQSVGLSKKQKQRLTQKKINSALKGAAVRRQNRIILTKQIHTRAKKQVGKISSSQRLFPTDLF